MPESNRSTNISARKNVRANMVKRIRLLGVASADTYGKREQQGSVVDPVANSPKMSPITINKVPRGKFRNRRTGPLGKMARIEVPGFKRT